MTDIKDELLSLLYSTLELAVKDSDNILIVIEQLQNVIELIENAQRVII